MKGSFPLPLDTPPMEAKAADVIPEGDDWQYEGKWDGFRFLAFRQGDAVELRAKSGKPLGRYFPELVATLRDLPSPRFVVDGEIVISVDGKPSFDALQMRLHPAESRIRKLSLETPAHIVVFDMLCDEHGTILLARTLEERRAMLEAFVASASRKDIVLSHCTRDVKEARFWLSDAGHGATDGVVAKRLDEPYQPGVRAMVKIKRLRSADCVVGGFRYLSNSPQVGSLLLGLYNDAGKLDHVGFTSTIAKRQGGTYPQARSHARTAGLHRKSAGRTEPLEHRTQRRMAAGSAGIGGGSAIRPRHGRSLPAWHQVPALAARQSAGAMHV